MAKFIFPHFSRCKSTSWCHRNGSQPSIWRQTKAFGFNCAVSGLLILPHNRLLILSRVCPGPPHECHSGQQPCRAPTMIPSLTSPVTASGRLVLLFNSSHSMVIKKKISLSRPCIACSQVGNYKKSVKRVDDGNRLCNELMNCIHERARIEKAYAQQLTEWGKRWRQLIEKGWKIAKRCTVPSCRTFRKYKTKPCKSSVTLMNTNQTQKWICAALT